MLHSSGQGVKTAVHFAQQDSVLSPSLRDAEQTVSPGYSKAKVQ